MTTNDIDKTGKNNTDMSMLEFLQDRAAAGRVRLHMPGHNGRALTGAFWEELFRIDVTELPDTDDLHSPCGMIARSQERAAALWGAKRSFYLVGSSTAGIIAGVLAAAESGTVILARNCHRSVYSACDVARVRKSFIMPRVDRESGIFLSVTPEQVRDAIRREKGRASLVVITSPTYEGVISDTAGIARVCREEGVPLMVDEAHGAHLAIGAHGGVFGGSAVRSGADIVIQSLHKTLPSPTQTGIAHFCSENSALEKRFVRMLEVVQSSSPSYILMAGMDACVRLMEERGNELMRGWKKLVTDARKELGKLKNVRVFGGADGVFMTDPAKICLIVPDGEEYARRLSDDGIDCEFALGRTVLLYTGAGTGKNDLCRAVEALKKLDGVNIPPVNDVPFPGILPRRARSVADNTFSVSDLVSPEGVLSSSGRVSPCYVWTYPPGIPLLCPGERLDKALAAWLAECVRAGVKLSIRAE